MSVGRFEPGLATVSELGYPMAVISAQVPSGRGTPSPMQKQLLFGGYLKTFWASQDSVVVLF